MHLVLAEDMLRRKDLSRAARCLLEEQQGPFLLGHTAPDVRTVSGQKREACHFYAVPRVSDRPAYSALFDAHPRLGRVEALSPPRAAFVAGYIAHLLLDEIWLDDVFRRFFLQDWGPLHERLFLHNVLRTWMDYRAQERLGGAVAQSLEEAEPDGWLPFVADEYLRVWRDWLAQQLGADQRMETADVFARRMGISPERIEALAGSPAEMEDRIFRRFPRADLRAFEEMGYRRSVLLVDWYLVGGFRGQSEPISSGLPFGQRTNCQSTLRQP
jgi:hypothetical protein